MTTLDLREQRVTVNQLMKLARSGSVLIVTQDGREFLLEEADDFDREVALLGQSDEFMSFLEKRSREKATISLDELSETLTPGAETP